ncbi:oligosaccharide flippase family protein [Candidatus Amesbacteria bacterium]|nr:oligosaccharide flippase family protein [Candidatus Amesbacteria bacterium]
MASVEVLETIVFYVIAVVLAWQGRGVTSYAWAVILRGIIGTSLIYYLAPWKIGLGFSKQSLKTLLSFGLPYQINSLMAVVKDRFVNIVLWKIIGADGVGIIGWAQTWSQKPLRFIMDNVTKVTFPAYARLQSHPDQLKSAIEKTLFFITLITFPTVGLLATLAPLAVKLIPRYSKWEAALLPLALFCFNSALAAVSTPLTNTLNALGKVKINTYLMIMWTVLTWGLTPALAIKYGYIGVAYATAIIALSSLVPVIIVKHFTRFSLINSVAKPAIATLVMLIPSLFINNLFLNFAISICVFIFAIYFLVGKSLFTDSLKLVHAFRKK